MKDIEDKLAAFLMGYGILKNRDAEKMARKIMEMFEKEREDLLGRIERAKVTESELLADRDRICAERDQLAAKCERLCDELSGCVSDQIDPSVNVGWMRCSPDLPKYVQGLEAKCAEMREVLKAHHEKDQEECLVYFKDDDVDSYPTNLGDSYSESSLAEKTTNALSDDSGKGWLSPEKKERLKRFTSHTPQCARFDFPVGTKPCDCGLEQAIDETK